MPDRKRLFQIINVGVPRDDGNVDIINSSEWDVTPIFISSWDISKASEAANDPNGVDK